MIEPQQGVNGVAERIGMVDKYVTANFLISSGTGGSVEIVDPPIVAGSVQSANIALFGNYLPASFVTAANGYGGTVLADGLRTARRQPLLAPPHA